MVRLFKYNITVFYIIIVAFTTIPFVSCKSITTTSTTTVYLETSTMKEAGENIVDSTMGPALTAIFLCEKKNTKNETVPWADAFLCISHNSNGTALDTVLLLDTSLRKMHHHIDPADYWTGLKKTAKLGRCKILIPTSLKEEIKRYKYKYCSVTLVTDD